MIDMPHLIVSLLDSSLMICVFYPVLDTLWWSLWLPVWRGQRQRLKAKGRLHTFFQCSCFLFLSIYIGLDETFTLTAQSFLHFDLWYFWHIRQVKRIRTSPCSGQKNWLVVWNIFLFSHILGISSSQLTHIVRIGSTYEKYSPSIFLRRLLFVGSWSPILTTSTRQAFRSKQSPCESAPWRCLLAKENVSESKAHHDLKWSTKLGYIVICS